MKISKKIRDEVLEEIIAIIYSNYSITGFCLNLVCEIGRPVEQENPEVADFIRQALQTYCEIPSDDPHTRKLFFAICLFALADMFRRQAEADNLERMDRKMIH